MWNNDMGDREKFFLNFRCGGNNEGTAGASLGMLSVVLRWTVQVFIQWVKYCLYVGSYKFCDSAKYHFTQT